MEELRRDLSVEAATVAAVEGRLAAEGEVDVLSLLRLRDQMKQQLTECSTALDAGQGHSRYHITEEDVTSVTKNLERIMEEVKVSFQNKTLALERIQLAAALRNKVEQNDNDSRVIVEIMKHIVKLSNAVIECQQQAREKEQQLMDIKRKRLSLKEAGEQKLLQIHTMMKKQEEEQASTEVSRWLKKIHKQLKKEREVTTVIQNVFQKIIIGSKVNWAEDPSLQAIVLQLEENVCFP